MNILTKTDIIHKLQAYATTSDDDVLRCKAKIKEALLKCPEILYLLNDKELETELFDEDGNINASYDENGVLTPEGEWDRYFDYHIKPYTFIEEVQDSSDNFICYTVSFSDTPRYNESECYLQVIFTIYCSIAPEQTTDPFIGATRCDLIASLIRERFAWSNIFGTRCKMVSNQEKITDSVFVTRQLIFQATVPNSQVVTPYNEKSSMINHRIRK